MSVRDAPAIRSIIRSGPRSRPRSRRWPKAMPARGAIRQRSRPSPRRRTCRAESFAALGALMSPQDIAVLFTPDAVEPPAEFKVVLADTGEQMIGTPVETPANGVDIVTLGVDDVPAMIELTALTKPGPFSARTHELGTFLGIRVDGQLVAMAGERMKPARLHRDHRRLRASIPSRPRLRADAALRHLAPDRVARRNSLPARLHQQSLGDCALPAAGDGNPPPSPRDGAEERGLIVQRCAP